jgi:ribosomal protein S18 acetylase RimI-like enzyme
VSGAPKEATGPSPGAPVDAERQPLVVRLGSAHDAAAAASMHVQEIGEGFLTELGEGFLEHLYRRVPRSPGSFLLVAEEGTETIGFLAGSVQVGALYRAFLRHDAWSAATTTLPRLVVRWRRVLETLRQGRRPTRADGVTAELLAVAVRPAWRRHGVARALVDRFLDEVRERHARHAEVVVGASNRGAINLYEGAGFEITERFQLHRGTDSVVMRQLVAPGPGGPPARPAPSPPRAPSPSRWRSRRSPSP